MYDIVGYDQQGNPVAAPIVGAPGARNIAPGREIARFQMASGDSVSVGANASERLTISVQAAFRTNFLVMSSTATGKSNVRVKSIKVGTREQLISKSSSISVDVFAPGNLLGKVEFDTAVPGVDITIELENISATAETISVATYGIRIDT